MERAARVSGPQGFYVFQTVLGSPLQFHPSLGTPELDSLVDAYLTYPASMQEKRAAVSVDFLEHYRCTGQNIKFYQVLEIPLASSASSPSSMQDSGYGSSFTSSPIAPSWSWAPAICPTSASTPASSSSFPVPHTPTHRAQQPSSTRNPPSSRHQLGDLSHLPGMKILTKDGRDVTNTALRGCKTKEQRDHAHLMRIMKACDSCKRKKVRCDPTHRTRTGVVTRPGDSPPRQAKRLRMETDTRSQPRTLGTIRNPQTLSPSPPSSFTPAVQPEVLNTNTGDFVPTGVVDDVWDEFITFNDDGELTALESFDFLPDLGTFVPAVCAQPPSTVTRPIDSGGLLVNSVDPVDKTILPLPTLPYLDQNETPHYYADFDLYSPKSSVSETEPLFVGEIPDDNPLSASPTISNVVENSRVVNMTERLPPGEISTLYSRASHIGGNNRVRSWVLGEPSPVPSSLISTNLSGTWSQLPSNLATNPPCQQQLPDLGWTARNESPDLVAPVHTAMETLDRGILADPGRDSAMPGRNTMVHTPTGNPDNHLDEHSLPTNAQHFTSQTARVQITEGSRDSRHQRVIVVPSGASVQPAGVSNTCPSSRTEGTGDHSIRPQSSYVVRGSVSGGCLDELLPVSTMRNILFTPQYHQGSKPTLDSTVISALILGLVIAGLYILFSSDPVPCADSILLPLLIAPSISWMSRHSTNPIRKTVPRTIPNYQACRPMMATY